MESTQNVMGSELRPGDLIWNEGHLWRVLETKHEVYTEIHSAEVRRWCVTCEWSGQGTDPKFFNDRIGFARREDLPWTRAVNVQDSLAANRVVARNLVCQVAYTKREMNERLSRIENAAAHLARQILFPDDACHPDFKPAA